jgi:hypothetical protein
MIRFIYRSSSGNIAEVEILTAVAENELRVGVDITWHYTESAQDVSDINAFVAKVINESTGITCEVESVTASSPQAAKRMQSAFLQFGDIKVGGQG